MSNIQKANCRHIEQKYRKKILLICDDIRFHSGVATIAREIVTHTAHYFNWIQLAGAKEHPEKGKVLDLSDSINQTQNLKDSYVRLYPITGYGNPTILREVMKIEKPDAIMLITDPRYFEWVFNMEQEIRKQIPITYLNIWDSLPAPQYNQSFYESCDLLMGISKQTKNINKMVLENGGINTVDLDEINPGAIDKNTKLLKYIPHGLNSNIYKPLPEDDKMMREMKKQMFGEKDPKFVVFFNSRNIRRKQIPDTILAFNRFLKELPYKERKECYLVLHTEIVMNSGTDLLEVRDYIMGEEYKDQVLFSTSKLSQPQLNCLYNIADVQILLSSNEGWGLSLTEAMLAGTPIIANTTGGIQDQMGFLDKDKKWFTPTPDLPSNHRGTLKEHGKWAFPVYPSNRSLQGSPTTPYIFDDRCKWEDAAKQLNNTYKLGRKKLKEKGLNGRKWATSNDVGFTSSHQSQRIIKSFNTLFRLWQPREKYEVVNTNEHKSKFIPHTLNY